VEDFGFRLLKKSKEPCVEREKKRAILTVRGGRENRASLRDGQDWTPEHRGREVKSQRHPAPGKRVVSDRGRGY